MRVVAPSTRQIKPRVAKLVPLSVTLGLDYSGERHAHFVHILYTHFVLIVRA